MTRRPAQRDLLDMLSYYIAYHKGVPILVGVGLALIGLILSFFPALSQSTGFWGWVVQSHLFLYLGVIVGLLGILIGDAL